MVGKQYTAAAGRVEPRPYPLAEALNLLKDIHFATFDETVELHVRLGVDPRRADQIVRGNVRLPRGTGKTVRVLAVATGEHAIDAQDAGADYVLGPEVVEKVQSGWLEFDAVVATPDMMRYLGRVGRVLGPRGLMPSPKSGTVTQQIGRAVREIKAGRVEFRVDKTSNLHVIVGKASFEDEALLENIEATLEAVVRAKPPGARGRYIRRVYLCTTMSPSVEIDMDDLASRVPF